MKVFVSQIYIVPGVSYPFTHHFQKFVSDQLTSRIVPADTFLRDYPGYDLVFRMSAKAGIARPEIHGPTFFKDDKNVEYTIFLTFDEGSVRGPDLYRKVLRQLIEQIVEIASGLHLGVSQLRHDASDIVERIIADPKMTRRN